MLIHNSEAVTSRHSPIFVTVYNTFLSEECSLEFPSIVLNEQSNFLKWKHFGPYPLSINYSTAVQKIITVKSL